MRFCHLTNLQRLNQSVEVQVLTFPTPAEVMNQVDPADTYFLVSDLAIGYHQIHIMLGHLSHRFEPRPCNQVKTEFLSRHFILVLV